MYNVVGTEIGLIDAVAVTGSISVFHYFSGYECF
jgi:hypothetical protein